MRLIPVFLLLLAARGQAQPAAELEAVVSTDLGTFRFEFAADLMKRLGAKAPAK